MLWLAWVQLHEPPNFWVRIGAFNLSLAIILGAFFGLSLRSYLLFAVDRECRMGEPLWRFAKGTILLGLGVLYANVAWPMLAWDRPARALAVITVVLPVLVAGFRHARGLRPGISPGLAKAISALLTCILLAATILTMLRSGLIALKTDRVTMILQVTGETRDEDVSLLPESSSTRTKFAKSYRVILWLSDGTKGADVWIPGDAVAFRGRAILFSKRLNKMGFPNLYQFESVEGVVSTSGNSSSSPVFAMPFPHTDSLAIRSWWWPIQNAIYNSWPRGSPEDSLLAIDVQTNRSDSYPLLNPDGTPVKERYLFDLTLDGRPTSRGSSPLAEAK